MTPWGDRLYLDHISTEKVLLKHGHEVMKDDN